MHLKVLSMTSLLVILVGSRQPLLSQQARSLADTTRLKCTFSIASTSDWGPAGARMNVRQANVMLEYRDIDSGAGTAQALSPSGEPHFISVRFVLGTLHLLSIETGLLSVTTVFSQTDHPGSYKAVLARHEFADVPVLNLELRPEQFTGECESAD
jgi:hypothetical protein